MSMRTLGLLFAVSLAAPAPAFAQPAAPLRVKETLGDASEVVCVAEDGAALWAGTLGAGVFRVAGGAQARFDAARGLPGNRVRDCARYRGELWVATEAGLARFDAAAQRFRLVQRGRFLRLAVHGDALLAARGDGLVQRFERGQAAAAQQLPAVPAALALAASGWALGGVDGSLYLAEAGAAPRRIAIPEQRGAPHEPIESLTFESSGLVATTASRSLQVAPGAQVAQVRPRARSAGPRATDPALRGRLVHARAALHGGGEAIATDTGLLLRAGPGAPLAALALDGQPCGDRISALAVQGDVLWIGSFDRGLCRLDRHGVQHFRGLRYLPSDMVNALAASDAQLFVATAGGLAIVQADGSFSSFTEQQCAGRLSARCPWHAAVNGVAVDPQRGDAWLVDIGAVHRIDPADGRWDHAPHRNELASRSLTRVAAFGGEVAIATSDRGLYLLRDGKLRAIDDQSGLADNWITDLAYDAGGQLWVATCTRGLSRRDVRGRLRTFRERDGLADDYVLSVQQLAGRVFVGTLRGLSVIDGERVTNLTVDDGLSGNEVHDAVEYRGAIWVATDGGLSVLETAAQ